MINEAEIRKAEIKIEGYLVVRREKRENLCDAWERARIEYIDNLKRHILAAEETKNPHKNEKKL